MTISRRTFVQSAATLLAAGCARPLMSGSSSEIAAGTNGARLPLGFSTLGCPSWDWPRILDFAQTHGFTNVELRGIGTQMDLPLLPEFQSTRLAQTRAELAAHGL